MLDKFLRAGLLWPTVLSIPVLAVLIALGSWQLQRKAWKDGLLAQIRARVDQPAQPLDAALRRFRAGQDIEYLHVSVRGKFLHEAEQHVYVPVSGGQGYHVYTPLQRAGGPAVLVNRGFVPHQLKDPARRAAGQVQGQIELTGLMRRPAEAGTFTPPSEPAKSLYFFADMAGMRLALQKRGIGPLAPVFIDADASPGNPGGWPRGGTTNLKLSNRHLEYAGTWYGLALTLIGVYVAFAAARLRGRRHP